MPPTRQSQTPNVRSRLSAFYLLFFISGGAALGYQIVWSRLFAFGLGHELPSVLAVVAAFFAGVALGAWWFGKRHPSEPTGGQYYAWAELLLGVWGLASIPLIPLANEHVLPWIGMDASPLFQWALAFLVPFVVLLPATVAMGVTFPAMERFVAPLVSQQRCVGILYAANTLGAVIGTLLAAFVFLPWLGFTRVLLLLATLNLLCGAAAWVLVSRSNWSASSTPAMPAKHANSTRLHVTLLVTGFLGIGYEVVGIRVLAHVLENTIFTFASVLAIYLAGTAAGGAWYQRCGRRFDSRNLLGWTLAAACATCALGGWLLVSAPRVYRGLRALFGDTVSGVMLAEMGVAMLVFAAPTLAMGILFSHLAQSARERRGGVGWALAVNTLGSAAAPGIIGVLLFPTLGAKWTLAVVSVGYLFLLPGFSALAAVAGALAAISVLAWPARLQWIDLPPGAALVEFRDGVMDSVAVVKHFDDHRSLLVNNRFVMGGTGAAHAARRHGHIPLLLHPRPRRALFLGLGTGITFAAATPHAELEADAVELVPEIPAVRRHFEPHNAARAGMRLFVADARRFVRANGTTYDVIVADLFHPARDGAGSLYTTEHFQAIRKRLAADGLFCQWLPLFQLDEPMLRVIVRSFLEVFPQAHAFLLRFNVDTPALALVGMMQPTLFPADWLQTRITTPELANELKTVGLFDRFHLFGLYVAGSSDLRSFAARARLNTDDQPVVLFGAPRFAYQRQETSYGRLLSLLEKVHPDPKTLIDVRQPAGAIFARELSEFIAARNVYVRGLALESEGRLNQAIEAYLESARRSPNFSTGYAHCLTIATQQARTNVTAARALLQRLIEAQPSWPVARELLERLKP